MSQSSKKLSTFEFLFSLQKRTVLTEKPVQIALTFLDFSQQLHNARENSNCLYTCRIMTLAIHGFFNPLDFTILNEHELQNITETNFFCSSKVY